MYCALGAHVHVHHPHSATPQVASCGYFRARPFRPLSRQGCSYRAGRRPPRATVGPVHSTIPRWILQPALQVQSEQPPDVPLVGPWLVPLAVARGPSLCPSLMGRRDAGYGYGWYKGPRFVLLRMHVPPRTLSGAELSSLLPGTCHAQRIPDVLSELAELVHGRVGRMGRAGRRVHDASQLRPPQDAGWGVGDTRPEQLIRRLRKNPGPRECAFWMKHPLSPTVIPAADPVVMRTLRYRVSSTVRGTRHTPNRLHRPCRSSTAGRNHLSRRVRVMDCISSSTIDSLIRP